MRLTFFDSFEFGIPEIDQGHRRIFYLFNEIGNCLDGGNFDSALRQVIHLIAVERVHVRFETGILEQLAYDKVEQHTEYHTALYNSLNNIMTALGDQNPVAAERYYADLYENIIDDILVADLPFKSLMQDRLLNR